MRRNAFILSIAFLVSLTACAKKNAQMGQAPIDAGSSVASTYQPLEDTFYPVATFPSYGNTVPVEATYELPADTLSSAPITETTYHTVARHDTLYSLARAYYGDHRRWKDIYQANSAMISDPNKIRVGQRLVIPN